LRLADCGIKPDGSEFIYYNKLNPEPYWTHIDYGFSILGREFIKSFEDKVPLDLSEPLMTASHEKKLVGVQCFERFWEIGSIEALDEFKKRFGS
jgi:hypothetical protein